MNPNAKRRSRAMEQSSGTLSASLGEPIDGTATESLSLIPGIQRDPAADTGFPRDQLLSKLKRECEVVLKLRLQHNHSGQHPQSAVDRHILLLVPRVPGQIAPRPRLAFGDRVNAAKRVLLSALSAREREGARADEAMTYAFIHFLWVFWDRGSIVDRLQELAVAT